MRLVGVLEAVNTTASNDKDGNAYKLEKVLQVLDNCTHLTRIACFYGESDGGIRGTGLTEATSGNGAFCVYSWAHSSGTTHYMLVQLTFSSTGNPSAPNGLLSKQESGYSTLSTSNVYGNIHLDFCADTASGNVWNGTTFNDGTDTKGDPVWAATGGANLLPFSYWNNDNSEVTTTNTTKNGMQPISSYDRDTVTLNILCSEDFLIISSLVSGSSTTSLFYHGRFIPAVQYLSNQWPWCQLTFNSTTHGLIASALFEPNEYDCHVVDGVKGAFIGLCWADMIGLKDSNEAQILQDGTTKFTRFPITLAYYDRQFTLSNRVRSIAGHINADYIGLVSRKISEAEHLDSGNYAVYHKGPQPTIDARRYHVWDGTLNVVPFLGATKEGYYFTRDI